MVSTRLSTVGEGGNVKRQYKKAKCYYLLPLPPGFQINWYMHDSGEERPVHSPSISRTSFTKALLGRSRRRRIGKCHPFPSSLLSSSFFRWAISIRNGEGHSKSFFGAGWERKEGDTMEKGGRNEEDGNDTITINGEKGGREKRKGVT